MTNEGEHPASPSAGIFPVRLEYDLSEREQIAAVTQANRRKVIGLGLLYVAFGVMTVFLAFWTTPDVVLWRLLGSIVGVVYLVLGLGRVKMWHDQIRGIIRRQPDAGAARVTLDESGFRTETSAYDTLMRWTGFTHYSTLDGPDAMVIFYRGPYMPFAVPRRACADEAEFRRVVEYAERHVGRTAVGARQGFEVEPIPDAEAAAGASNENAASN